MRLIRSLPMQDVIFSGLLREKNLLPGDLMEQIRAKNTVAEMATLFLDEAIETPLSVGNFEPLNTLLTVKHMVVIT